jgi:hypothetical protein
MEFTSLDLQDTRLLDVVLNVTVNPLSTGERHAVRGGQGVHCVGRSTSPQLPRGRRLARFRVSSVLRRQAPTPLGEVQPVWGPCRPGSSGLSFFSFSGSD